MEKVRIELKIATGDEEHVFKINQYSDLKKVVEEEVPFIIYSQLMNVGCTEKEMKKFEALLIKKANGGDGNEG